MPQPLIVERHQAEFCEEVNEPAPLELQLDLGEVEPGWESPSVQQAAQGVSKTLLVQTLVSITSLSFKLPVLDQSLGEIKHANDVATEKFFVCHFLPQPCGKLPRRKSMGGVGGGEAGQPGGCALAQLGAEPPFQLALPDGKPRGVVWTAGGEKGSRDRGLPQHPPRHLLLADLALKKVRQVNCCCRILVLNLF